MSKIRAVILKRDTKENPCVEFDALFIDAGDIPQGTETYEYCFPFSNAGAKELIIAKVKTRCQCTAVIDRPEQAIPAGTTEKIVIRYQVGEKYGKFIHDILVQTNDPSFPFIKLFIAGNALQRIIVKPKRLTWKVTEGECAMTQCFIRYTGDGLLKLFDPTSDIPGVRINIQQNTVAAVKEIFPSVPISKFRPDNFFLLDIRYDGARSDCIQNCWSSLDKDQFRRCAKGGNSH